MQYLEKEIFLLKETYQVCCDMCTR